MLRRTVMISLLLVCMLVAFACTAQADDGIAIDEAHFPDESFRTYVLQQVDMDGDGVLSAEEADDVELIYIDYYEGDAPVASLQGIECFPELRGISVEEAELTEIDLSHNLMLSSLDISGNNLTELDVSMLPRLQELSANNNQLATIHFGENSKLEYLFIGGNRLSDLDISTLSGLEDLDVSNNQLTRIDVSNNLKVWEIKASHNPIGDIDVTHLSNLAGLFVDDCGLSTIDLTHNTELQGLSINDNSFTDLDLSQNPALSYLYCHGNQLTSLHVNFARLQELDVSNNLLSELDLSGGNLLSRLHCEGNGITSLDFSNHGKLKKTYLRGMEDASLREELDGVIRFYNIEEDDSNFFDESEYSLSYDENVTLTVWQNADTEPLAIDAAHFPDAAFRTYVSRRFDLDEDGSLSGPEIESAVTINFEEGEEGGQAQQNVADMTGIAYLTELMYLNINFTQVQSLDLSQNHRLDEVYCSDCGLMSLNLSGCESLTRLECNNNNLTSLDLSGCPSLNQLFCSNNQLAELDVKGLVQLESLCCGNNQLTELSVRRLIHLEYMECENNQLSELDVSRNAKLFELNCKSNRLTALYTGENPSLKTLICSDNSLGKLDIHGNPQIVRAFTEFTPEQIGMALHYAVIDFFDDDENIEYNYRYPALAVDVGVDVIVENELGEGEIPIDAAHFPDKYFRAYIAQQIDGNGDGVLSAEEIERTEEIQIWDEPIASLEGIEWFPDLKYLYVNHAALTEVDLSGNTRLESLGLESNQLTSLDISMLPELDHLDVSGNQLSAIDLGNHSKLRDLLISYNPIGSIDVTALPELEWLEANGCGLSAIDLTHNDKVEGLYINDNSLNQLDLSANRELTTLECANNRLRALDLAQNTSISSLICNGNRLVALDISPLGNLYELNASDNHLAGLDLSACGELNRLYCEGNGIDQLDLRRHSRLKSAYANAMRDSNLREEIDGAIRCFVKEEYSDERSCILSFDDSVELTLWQNADAEPIAIDAEHFPDDAFRAYIRERFDVDGDGELSGPEIETALSIDINQSSGVWDEDLDVTGIGYLTELKTLYISTYISSLDVSGNPRLQMLGCESCGLESLNVDGCSELNSLYCSGNNLKSLDVSSCASLGDFDCSNNQLTELDVSGLSRLCNLVCENNSLTELSLAGCINMRWIFCDNNQLQKLDVSSCTLLQELECKSNQLTDIRLGENPLTWLNCENNRLEKLDLRGCARLLNLTCSGNPMEKLDISGCPNIIRAFTKFEPVQIGNVLLYADEYDDNGPRLGVDVGLEIVTEYEPSLTLSREQYPLYLTARGFGAAGKLELSGDEELIAAAEWNTGNADVVTVDNGRLAAIGTGSTIITVTSGDISLACEVTVARLDTVALPESLVALEAQAFSGAAAIQCVDIPETVAEIGTGAFEGCTALQLIRIPASVESIAQDAFAGTTQVRISCKAGSVAERFAIAHGMDYIVE